MPDLTRTAVDLALWTDVVTRTDSAGSTINEVEQLTRYLELPNRDPALTRLGISCAVVDYDALRGMDDPSQRLF